MNGVREQCRETRIEPNNHRFETIAQNDNRNNQRTDILHNGERDAAAQKQAVSRRKCSKP